VCVCVCVCGFFFRVLKQSGQVLEIASPWVSSRVSKLGTVAVRNQMHAFDLQSWWLSQFLKKPGNYIQPLFSTF
jgi:hypothetical protein